MKRIFFILTIFIFLFSQTTFSKTIRLRFASYFPTAAPQSKLLEEFCKDVEKYTNGKIKIDFFGGGSLLKATKVYDGIESGIADIGFSHIEYTRGRFPLTEILDLPVGFPDAWVATHVVNDFYEKYKPKEWQKVHILWFNTCPVNQLITVKPVYKLEDLKGLVIRAPGKVGEIVKALGGSPKPVPLNEIYEAMSRGVVDGSMTPLETLKSFRLAEVAKYVTLCGEATNVYTFYVIMNKDRWNSLEDKYKNILSKIAGIYQERAALVWSSVDKMGVEEAQKNKIKFIRLDDQELLRWKKKVKPLILNYINYLSNKGFNREKLKEMIEFIYKRIDYWKKQEKYMLNQ